MFKTVYIIIIFCILQNTSINVFAESKPSILIDTAEEVTVNQNEDATNALPVLDDPEIQKLLIDESEGIDLILQARVKNLILGDEFSIKKNNVIYIGMKNLFDILDFAILVNIDEKHAKGWFIKEKHLFKMKKPNFFTGTTTLTANNKRILLSKNQILYKSDDIYIEAASLFDLLNIGYKIILKDLLLILEPAEPLPIQLKLERQKRKPLKKRSLIAKLPQRRIPYKAWSIPLIDLQTRYYTNNIGTKNINYSALGSGDFAYMTGTYFAQGNNEDSLKNFRFTLSKNSIKNNLLGPLKASHISLGEINPNAGGGVGNSGQEVGVRISNRSSNRNVNLKTSDFIGDAQPGWDVELYRNSIFIGGQTVSDNGRYEFFNNEIYAGKNIFRLVFFGPQGQTREKIREIDLQKGGINTEKLLYDISLSTQNSRLFYLQKNQVEPEAKHRRFNLNIFKDINEYISLQTSYSTYTFTDGTKHSFLKPGIRIFLFNTLFSGVAIKDIEGGESVSTSISKVFWRQSFSLSSTTTSEDYALDSEIDTPAQKSTRIGFSGPLIRSRFLTMNYSTDATRSTTDNSQKSDLYNVKLSASIKRLTLSNNLKYVESSANNLDNSRSLSGIGNIHVRLFGTKLRAGGSYILEPTRQTRVKQVTKLSASVSRSLTNRIRTQYNYNYIPISKNSSHGLSLNWRAKKFNLITNFSYSKKNYTAYIGLSFHLGYDHKTSRLNIGPERISRGGAISAKIFLDDNNNGIYDKNETTIENAKIKIEQANKLGKTDTNGNVFIPGLATDRATDVALDVKSLDDPFLTPSTLGFSFIPRPGLIQEIEIPLVISGEIEGTINLVNDNGTLQTAGYVPLTLTNIKTRQVRSVLSAYDGFYLFSNIPPGKYLASVDKLYLKRNKMDARKPMPRFVTIRPSGNVEMGNDFIIFTKK